MGNLIGSSRRPATPTRSRRTGGSAKNSQGTRRTRSSWRSDPSRQRPHAAGLAPVRGMRRQDAPDHEVITSQKNQAMYMGSQWMVVTRDFAAYVTGRRSSIEARRSFAAQYAFLLGDYTMRSGTTATRRRRVGLFFDFLALRRQSSRCRRCATSTTTRTGRPVPRPVGE